MRTFFLLILLTLARPAAGEELSGDTGNEPPADTHATVPADETHPILSYDSRWVTSLLIGVTGLFIAAMVIGPIVKSEAPEAVPDAMSHEEDPAADRH